MFENNIYTLLNIYITNKNLPYSTGNSTQYFVSTYKGKKSEKKKRDIYVCITESLCYTSETNTILQISYTSIKKIARAMLNCSQCLIIKNYGLPWC